MAVCTNQGPLRLPVERSHRHAPSATTVESDVGRCTESTLLSVPNSKALSIFAVRAGSLDIEDFLGVALAAFRFRCVSFVVVEQSCSVCVALHQIVVSSPMHPSLQQTEVPHFLRCQPRWVREVCSSRNTRFRATRTSSHNPQFRVVVASLPPTFLLQSTRNCQRSWTYELCSATNVVCFVRIRKSCETTWLHVYKSNTKSTQFRAALHLDDASIDSVLQRTN